MRRISLTRRWHTSFTDMLRADYSVRSEAPKLWTILRRFRSCGIHIIHSFRGYGNC